MEKEKRKLKKSILIAIIAVAVALVVGAGATFAWFSNNSRVTTNSISGKTGSGNVELLMGNNADNLPAAGTEVELVQANSANKEKLYPVSTADLNQFLCAPTLEGGYAENFVVDESESRLYHAILYIRAQSSSENTSGQMTLYLDSNSEFGGDAASDAVGNIFNAARLGIKIENVGYRIISFSENTKGATQNNTKINGVVLENGYVLSGSGSDVTAVLDPSVTLASVSVDSSADTIVLPENSLGTIDFNTTYKVDVYFYLEGCDEDCVSEIGMSSGNIHIALYGAVE